MNSNDLLLHVECYVGLRSALGYRVRCEEKLLKEFVFFVVSRGVISIRAQTAIDWACSPAPRRGLAGQVGRLKVVRGFLSHLRATLPETEVPDLATLACVRRPKPYLYSRSEIQSLMEEALKLGPKDSLRPHVYYTLIGLLASSGLRVGEALQLNVNDVRLNANPPHVEVVKGKFRKSRLVPIHETAVGPMLSYADKRRRWHYDGLSDAFFVSERGGPISYDACWDTFAGLVHRTGIHKEPHTGRPCLHALRHSFAVSRMTEWYRAGTSVQDVLPHLSVYLGHVQPAHTYWYLTATPELLDSAADTFLRYAGKGPGHETL